MRHIVAALIFCIMPLKGVCCFNSYRATLGKTAWADFDNGFYPEVLRGQLRDTSELRRALESARARYQSGKGLDDYSDYGVQLAFNNRLSEAEAIFLQIEAQKPGQYATAANLGTTYELMGKNNEALQWIKRALKVYPDSHQNSEWIHVKILEAKIAAKGDDSYYNTHDILGLYFGDKGKPAKQRGDKVALLLTQLEYQLKERLSLIKPKDVIVGQLLFDYANLWALDGRDLPNAVDIYREAKRFGFDTPLLEERMSVFDSLQQVVDKEHRQGNASYDNTARDTTAVLDAPVAKAAGHGAMLKIILASVLIIVAAVIIIVIRRRR